MNVRKIKKLHLNKNTVANLEIDDIDHNDMNRVYGGLRETHQYKSFCDTKGNPVPIPTV